MRKIILASLLMFSIAGGALAQSDSASGEVQAIIDQLMETTAKQSPAPTTPPPSTTPALDSENFYQQQLGSLDIESMVQQLGSGSSGLAPSVDIRLDPPHPQPGETVTASINDYSSQMYGAEINWKVDGRTITEAKNRRSYVFTASAAGKSQTIVATLYTSAGETIEFKKTITPMYLDIIVEPQTHVPSFYNGRPLPSTNSKVLVTALLSEPVLKEADLVYTWRVNRDVIENGPIRGRNNTIFEMPRGFSVPLSLEVGTLEGVIIASRTVLIPSVRPEVSFYEANPLYGISKIAIDTNYPLIGKSVTIQAEPYYLDSAVYNSPDILEWEIDRRLVENSSFNPYMISLQRSSNTGSSEINFHVRDQDQLLQGAESAISINF